MEIEIINQYNRDIRHVVEGSFGDFVEYMDRRYSHFDEEFRRYMIEEFSITKIEALEADETLYEDECLSWFDEMVSHVWSEVEAGEAIDFGHLEFYPTE